MFIIKKNHNHSIDVTVYILYIIKCVLKSVYLKNLCVLVDWNIIVNRYCLFTFLHVHVCILHYICCV